MVAPNVDARPPANPDLPPGLAVPDFTDDSPSWLARLGLDSLEAPLIDLFRPVAWIGAQALLVAQPTLALFGAGAAVARLADRWAALDAAAPDSGKETP
jgi:hypothetical protein